MFDPQIQPGGQHMEGRLPNYRDIRAMKVAEKGIEQADKSVDARAERKMNTLNKIDKGNARANDAAYNRVANQHSDAGEKLARINEYVTDQQLIASGRMDSPFKNRRKS